MVPKLRLTSATGELTAAIHTLAFMLRHLIAIAYVCHGRLPEQAKTDVVAMSQTALMDKAGMTSLRIFWSKN